jgi:hypothetical protein
LGVLKDKGKLNSAKSFKGNYDTDPTNYRMRNRLRIGANKNNAENKNRQDLIDISNKIFINKSRIKEYNKLSNKYPLLVNQYINNKIKQLNDEITVDEATYGTY